ncbi:MAG: hypothetical protein FD149_2745 [Rhodospirillaceae bacterium]|nr:MAG: hypothetical protein FD149_2745 [Rhodospirillaceae bacterium]
MVCPNCHGNHDGSPAGARGRYLCGDFHHTGRGLPRRRAWTIQNWIVRESAIFPPRGDGPKPLISFGAKLRSFPASQTRRGLPPCSRPRRGGGDGLYLEIGCRYALACAPVGGCFSLQVLKLAGGGLGGSGLGGQAVKLLPIGVDGRHVHGGNSAVLRLVGPLTGRTASERCSYVSDESLSRPRFPPDFPVRPFPPFLIEEQGGHGAPFVLPCPWLAVGGVGGNYGGNHHGCQPWPGMP